MAFAWIDRLYRKISVIRWLRLSQFYLLECFGVIIQKLVTDVPERGVLALLFKLSKGRIHQSPLNCYTIDINQVKIIHLWSIEFKWVRKKHKISMIQSLWNRIHESQSITLTFFMVHLHELVDKSVLLVVLDCSKSFLSQFPGSLKDAYFVIGSWLVPQLLNDLV